MYHFGSILKTVFFLIFFFLQGTAKADSFDTLIVENINDQLLYYSDADNSYIAYNKDIHRQNNIAFYIKDDTYRDSSFFLQIKGSNPFAVFIDNQLLNTENSVLYMSLVKPPFKPDNLPSFVNLYSKDPSCHYNVNLIRIVASEDKKGEQSNVMTAVLADPTYKNFSFVYTIGFVVVLILLLACKMQFPQHFKNHISVQRLFLIGTYAHRKDILNINNLMFFILIGGILGFLSVIFQEDFISKSHNFSDQNRYFSFFAFNFLQNAALILLIFAGKYIIHKLFGNAFRVQDFTDIAYNEFIAKVAALSTYFFFISMLFIPFVGYFDPELFKYVLYIFVILFIMLLLNLDILNYNNFRFHKFLLFLYICTADLFPLIIAFRIIIK